MDNTMSKSDPYRGRREDTKLQRLATVSEEKESDFLHQTAPCSLETKDLDSRDGATESLSAKDLSQPLSSPLRNRGFELRLVLEFCDCGNLRQVLDQVRASV